MLKYKRSVKIVSILLAITFIFSNFNLNVFAKPYGTANVATGSGDVGN